MNYRTELIKLLAKSYTGREKWVKAIREAKRIDFILDMWQRNMEVEDEM
jgi:hypothetical protein